MTARARSRLFWRKTLQQLLAKQRARESQREPERPADRQTRERERDGGERDREIERERERERARARERGTEGEAGACSLDNRWLCSSCACQQSRPWDALCDRPISLLYSRSKHMQHMCSACSVRYTCNCGVRLTEMVLMPPHLLHVATQVHEHPTEPKSFTRKGEPGLPAGEISVPKQVIRADTDVMITHLLRVQLFY